MTLAATSQSGLLILWITFTTVALAGAIAVFVWAVRARQFSDQDRARYLPLKSGIPDVDAPAQAGPQTPEQPAPRAEPPLDAARGGGSAEARKEDERHVPS